MKYVVITIFFFVSICQISGQDWAHRFHFDDDFRIDEESVICLEDGSCIISGEFSQLVKIDVNGNFLWRRNFGEDELLEVFRFRQLSSDTILAWARGQKTVRGTYGIEYVELGVLLKLDTAGRILEKHQYAPSELGFDNFRPTGHAGFEIINDTLCVASLPTGLWTGVVLGLNPKGGVYWIKENPQHVLDLVADGTGQVIGAATLNVYRIDTENGDLIWEINEQLTATLVRRKGNFAHRDMLNIIRNSEGDFLCASQDLAKIDVNSNCIWEVESGAYTYDIAPVEDSYYIANTDTIFQFDDGGNFLDTILTAGKVIRNMEQVDDQLITFGWHFYEGESANSGFALEVHAWTPGNDFPDPDSILIDPAPIGDLRLYSLAGLTSITLSWNDMDGEEFYILQRSSIDQNSLVDYDTIQSDQINYTDLNVVKGTTYHYRLKATNNNGQNISWIASRTPISTIQWVGTENDLWHEASNWDEGRVPSKDDHVWIRSGYVHAPSISSFTDAQVNDLYIDEGAVLYLKTPHDNVDYASLTVYGDLYNDGLIDVGAESSIKLLGDRTGKGKERMSRLLLNQGALQSVTIPFSDLIYDSVSADFIYIYNNESSAYERPPLLDQINAGSGFFVGSNQAYFNLDLQGELNHGQIYANVTKELDGFNLLGNPYGAAISYQKFFDDSNNRVAITGSAYIWNDAGVNEGSKRGGDFIVVNSMGSIGNLNPDGGVSGNKSVNDFLEIGSFQGFFVETALSGTSVRFKPDMQLIDYNADEAFFRRFTDEVEVKLYVKNDRGYYETLIVLNEEATYDEDYSMDAKYFNSGSGLAIYSLIEAKAFSILALPLDRELAAVSLGVETRDSSQYELGVASLSKMSCNIFLLDAWSGKKYELSEDFALKEVAHGKRETNRWSILFVDQVLGNPLIETSDSKLQVFGNTTNQKILLEVVDEIQHIKIFDLTGKIVYHETVIFNHGEAHVNAKLNSNQIYLLEVNNVRVKFMIR